MQQLILILLCMIYANQIYATAASFAYRCKAANGSVGYYAHPCNYMASLNTGILRGQQITEEKVFLLKSYSSNQKRIYDINLLTQKKQLPEKSENLVKKSRKKLTSTQLANKRCKNSIAKISTIQELLKNKQGDQLSSKLKRALVRYKAINKKYCVQDI